ncbi:MAG: tetraacyldisaccharide 4'-kinase, partial [Flavobacteriales bacterium]|nr:tetraacyldisaccharide 4'-kinase [Flavobacteriales bacterium]
MDVVIVTKCPKDADRDPLVWRKKLKMRSDQELFFSEEHHLCPTWADPKRDGAIPTGTGTKAVLFTGIASAASLLDHCRTIWNEVKHVPFRDHHAFSTRDLERLASLFDTFAAGRGVLVTTAKDAARARHLLPGSALDGLPLVIIGVEARILDRQNEFETIIMTHARPH